MGTARYRHLSFEEREQIAIWRLEGVSQAAMARRLGRSSSTINRELARSGLPLGGYQPSFAEGVKFRFKRRRVNLIKALGGGVGSAPRPGWRVRRPFADRPSTPVAA